MLRAHSAAACKLKSHSFSIRSAGVWESKKALPHPSLWWSWVYLCEVLILASTSLPPEGEGSLQTCSAPRKALKSPLISKGVVPILNSFWIQSKVNWCEQMRPNSSIKERWTVGSECSYTVWFCWAVFALYRPGYAKNPAKVWLETGFLLVLWVPGLASAPDLLCKEWSTVLWSSHLLCWLLWQEDLEGRGFGKQYCLCGQRLCVAWVSTQITDHSDKTMCKYSANTGLMVDLVDF